MIFNGYLRFKQHELHSEPALSENKFSDRQTLNKRFQSRTLLRDRRRLDVFSQPTFPRSLPAGFLLRCQGWISHSPSSPIPETDYRETGLGRRRRRSRNAFCYFTFNSVRKQLRGEWFSVPVRLCSFPTCTFSSLSLHWSLWQQWNTSDSCSPERSAHDAGGKKTCSKQQRSTFLSLNHRFHKSCWCYTDLFPRALSHWNSERNASRVTSPTLVCKL